MLMVAGFLGVMSQLMIVIGGLGLASTMSLAVLERTREIGVLRAIGAPHAPSSRDPGRRLVVAVLSWAMALPLSVPMSVVLGRAFGRIMIPVPDRFVPECAGVVQWLAVVLVVSVAAAPGGLPRHSHPPRRSAIVRVTLWGPGSCHLHSVVIASMIESV